jgi:glycosyltransferase involved in cell wall biosynthesis
MTIDSVLRQTYAPEEILVLDDGSTDDTVSILRSYEPGIKVLQQENRGVANARNTLCDLARGDVIAFLDHDDVWHPSYLEVQARNLAARSEAVAVFAGHVEFYGYEDYVWPKSTTDDYHLELIEPIDFFRRYDTTSGLFGSASFFCVPKEALFHIGKEPFKVSGVDDAYLCMSLTLSGSVAYSPVPLVAYRITEAAQSTDKLKAYGLWVEVFQLLEPHFQSQASPDLLRVFRSAFASRRRQYAKRLMGADRTIEARRQLRVSLSHSRNVASLAKSLGLLAASFMPTQLQPAWPAAQRDWREPEA